MARKGSLEAERQAIARERNALEAREAKLRMSEQAAMAELLRKSALGKAPFERVERLLRRTRKARPGRSGKALGEELKPVSARDQHSRGSQSYCLHPQAVEGARLRL
jgi:hypothetical protein